MSERQSAKSGEQTEPVTGSHRDEAGPGGRPECPHLHAFSHKHKSAIDCKNTTGLPENTTITNVTIQRDC